MDDLEQRVLGPLCRTGCRAGKWSDPARPTTGGRSAPVWSAALEARQDDDHRACSSSGARWSARGPASRGQLSRRCGEVSDALPLTYSIDALGEVDRTSLLTDTLLRDLGVMAGATAVALVLGALTLRRRSGTPRPTARRALLVIPLIAVGVAGAGTAHHLLDAQVYVTTDDARIDETAIGDVRVGQPVDITVDAYPDVTLAGTVAEIQGATARQPTADDTTGRFRPTTQVVSVEIALVDHGNRTLVPGMSATVRIVR